MSNENTSWHSKLYKMFLNGEEKQWQHEENAVWGCMTEEESLETKGVLREEVGVLSRLRYSKRIWKRGGI